ncbi:vanomycin resistance protein VanB [Desulfofundulus thermobenzoicus]|uniref:Vanomycin resistance protein VanB n=1 Tax=Desulfofundulus thermobenzoicus TaxID=29376 RepID=A0A6N7IQ81_9FIRM|nr:VanW family protein [Desulfofundulus thermobenzoicus]MQL52150.1 vanomycin resistance protein VanB [Desulfofundulus thermobenzoicus]
MTGKRFRWTLLLVLVGLVTGTMLVLGATFVARGAEKVFPGVRAASVDLSGLDRDGCRRALASLEGELSSSPVVLLYQDRSWKLSPGEIGLHLDGETMISAAFKAGREGNWWRQWMERRRIKQEGFPVPLAVVINKEQFNRRMDALSREIATPPRDAAFRIRPDDTVEIIPGAEGMQVDGEKAYRDLLAALSTGKNPQVELALVKVAPRVTTAQVEAMGLKGLLSSYTTRFDAGYTDRTYNIRVAAAALDGLLVPPGQEVSFNKVVGPRSSEAGYKNAQVIVNNRVVDGLGGGVCQVSSTLYNAVLLANLEVLDRTNHSLPVAYVPMGRDATVVYGTLDFRFRNNTESYIYVRSFVQGGQLTFKIYGNTDYKVPVEIRTRVTEVREPKVVRQPDPDLKRGEEVVKQKGARGYRVEAQRVVREKGVVHTENLPVSIYEPVDQIVAVGTREPGGGPVIPPQEPAGRQNISGNGSSSGDSNPSGSGPADREQNAPTGPGTDAPGNLERTEPGTSGAVYGNNSCSPGSGEPGKSSPG